MAATKTDYLFHSGLCTSQWYDYTILVVSTFSLLIDMVATPKRRVSLCRQVSPTFTLWMNTNRKCYCTLEATLPRESRAALLRWQMHYDAVPLAI